MLDTYRVRTRIEEIRRRVENLIKKFQSLSEKELTEDEILYAAAERNLEVAIQACLDIANHLVSALGLKRPDKKVSEVFTTLAEEKIIEEKLALTMQKVAGYRNVLVHEYLFVDRHLTYINIQKNLQDLVDFGKEIEIFLEKRENKQKEKRDN